MKSQNTISLIELRYSKNHTLDSLTSTCEFFVAFTMGSFEKGAETLHVVDAENGYVTCLRCTLCVKISYNLLYVYFCDALDKKISSNSNTAVRVPQL